MNQPLVALGQFGLGLISGVVVDNVFQYLSLGDDDAITEALELAVQVMADGLVLNYITRIGVDAIDPGDVSGILMYMSFMQAQPNMMMKTRRLVARLKLSNMDAIDHATERINKKRVPQVGDAAVVSEAQ